MNSREAVSSREAVIGRFLRSAGWGDATRLPLGADWSNRRYERLVDGERRAVLMDAARDTPVHAFVTVARWLRSIGLHAPLILGAAESDRLLLLEDLGDDLVARVLASGGDEPTLYALATDVVLHFQTPTAPIFLPVLDEAALLALLDIFLDFELPGLGITPRASFKELWSGLLPRVKLGRDVFLYRDYHAENMLWLPGESGLMRLGLLDFQDAFRGPAVYDLVSLIQDARRDVGPAVEALVLDKFRAARPELDPVRLDTAIAILGAQRAMRILGVLRRLTVTAHRTLPPGLRARVLGHLRRNLDHPALAGLAAWCARYYPPASELP